MADVTGCSLVADNGTIVVKTARPSILNRIGWRPLTGGRCQNIASIAGVRALSTSWEPAQGFLRQNDMSYIATLVVLAFLLVLGACANPASNGVDNAAQTSPPATPSTTTTVAREQQLPADTVALNALGRPATGPFFLESAELMVAESFPLQIFVSVEGSLPTPCDEVDWVITVGDDRIDIDLYAVAEPAVICVAMLQPVAFTISVGSFGRGSCTVYINGDEIGYFET